MSYKIITISREFGSGGHTVGRRLAEELGIKCYDREIIDRVAEESGFDKDYIKEKGEYVPHGPFGNMMNRWSYYGPTNEERIWQIQSDIILDIAERESCVIVGRCADYLLKDRDDVLRTFIHADKAYRAERIVRLYGETNETPEKRLADKDKHRKAYYQVYTDMEYGDARNYQICLDTGALGEDYCVELLKQIFTR
ncbi:MAG: cytidylate kinase-like family protein [Lachnospiraceae bacterium]|nr:cytidylate kinase-like family protein [Lachnospiraceae bacterium]